MSSSEARNNHLPKGPAITFAKVWRLVSSWFSDKTLLFEAFLFAVSLHVLSLPVIWVMGWALPWPKGPTITTIIEYDLRNWPNVTKPKRIFNFREPARNQ